MGQGKELAAMHTHVSYVCSSGLLYIFIELFVYMQRWLPSVGGTNALVGAHLHLLFYRGEGSGTTDNKEKKQQIQLKLNSKKYNINSDYLSGSGPPLSFMHTLCSKRPEKSTLKDPCRFVKDHICCEGRWERKVLPFLINKVFCVYWNCDVPHFSV